MSFLCSKLMNYENDEIINFHGQLIPQDILFKRYFSQENNRARNMKQLSIVSYRILLFRTFIVYVILWLFSLGEKYLSWLDCFFIYSRSGFIDYATKLGNIEPLFALQLNKDLTSLDF